MACNCPPSRSSENWRERPRSPAPSLTSTRSPRREHNSRTRQGPKSVLTCGSQWLRPFDSLFRGPNRKTGAGSPAHHNIPAAVPFPIQPASSNTVQVARDGQIYWMPTFRPTESAATNAFSGTNVRRLAKQPRQCEVRVTPLPSCSVPGRCGSLPIRDRSSTLRPDRSRAVHQGHVPSNPPVCQRSQASKARSSRTFDLRNLQMPVASPTTGAPGVRRKMCKRRSH